MNDSTTETTAITMADVSQAVHDGHLRADFLTRVRVHFETDADVEAWFSRTNTEYHGLTPWETFYDQPRRQGDYIDATCNVFVYSLYKRLPADLPALPPAPSED